jgi:hypothetical protein
VEFSPGNPVPDPTGLAYDYNGNCYVLYRTGQNVDWEIAKFPSNNPSAAVPYITISNSSGLTDLRDLEYSATSNEFYFLDRTNAANNDYKIHSVSANGGLTIPIWGATLISSLAIENIQGLDIGINGNIYSLDKHSGMNNGFTIREIDKVLLKEISSHDFTFPNSAGTNNFALANISYHDHVITTNNFPDEYIGSCPDPIMNQWGISNVEDATDHEVIDLASK